MRATVERPVRLGRVAFTPDLGGITPVDAEIAAICRQAAARFAALGAEVEEASPDLGTAIEVFTVLRAAQFAASMAPLLEQHRDRLKPEVVWNIEHGLRLTADEIGRAERERGLLQRRMAEFMGRYDLLLCPAAIVPPFPVETRYLAELNGHRFPSYIDWVTIAYAITLTACPALSLPCGFTADGLPGRAADRRPAARRGEAAGRGRHARGRARPRGLGADRSAWLTRERSARLLGARRDDEPPPRMGQPWRPMTVQQHVADRIEHQLRLTPAVMHQRRGQQQAVGQGPHQPCRSGARRPGCARPSGAGARTTRRWLPLLNTSTRRCWRADAARSRSAPASAERSGSRSRRSAAGSSPGRRGRCARPATGSRTSIQLSTATPMLQLAHTAGSSRIIGSAPSVACRITSKRGVVREHQPGGRIGLDLVAQAAAQIDESSRRPAARPRSVATAASPRFNIAMPPSTGRI